MDSEHKINCILFIWQTRGAIRDKVIIDTLLPALNEPIIVARDDDERGEDFWDKVRLNGKYVDIYPINGIYKMPALVIMRNGYPYVSKYYQEVKYYLDHKIDMTPLAIKINKKVADEILKYGYEPTKKDN
jgi:hypothetical protein